MKISFLVTYYNQAQYVKNSLDSILAMDLPEEWEILVGDDGSTDETTKIVNEYIKANPEHIRLIIMPREAGKKYESVARASENRLTLLQNCTGDCFCSLDGDDFYVDRNFVKDAISVFEKDAGISIVSFGYRYYQNGEMGKEWLLPIGTDSRIEKGKYISDWYLHAGACAYRKSFGKERISYIRSLGSSFDDNDIVMNSFFFGDMYYINRCIYAYRQEGESIYSSMNQLEKALLNISGIDSGEALLGREWEDQFVERYHNAVLTVFYWREALLANKDNAKIRYYINEILTDPSGLPWRVLHYSQLKQGDRKAIRRMIHQLEQTHQKEAAKLRIKHILRGVL